jgi:hypothetical protein
MMEGYTMRDRYENSTSLKTQMRVDSHGIHRWRDSDQVPCERILCRIGLTPEGLDRHASARDADLDAFAAEHLRRRGLRTPEEIAEERAADRKFH